MGLAHLDDEKASIELKDFEDYINSAISHIENGADETREFNTLKYIISIA